MDPGMGPPRIDHLVFRGHNTQFVTGGGTVPPVGLTSTGANSTLDLDAMPRLSAKERCMSDSRECSSRSGEVTCFNDKCPRGCVRNFRDQPNADVPLASYKDAAQKRRKPWEQEMGWLMRFLAKL